MNKVLDFIENHKFGIIITLVIHVLLFIYFQVETYREPVAYDTWDYRSNQQEAPDDIEITPDQIETPQEAELFENEKVTSHVKSSNDEREQSAEENVRYTSFEGDPAQNVKDYESEILKELNEGKEQETSETAEADIEKEDKKETKNNTSKTSGEGASEKAIKGKTMVEYNLSDRHPFNRNDWYVRNPGYTCGNVNGVVRVRIKVAQSGDVVDAKYIPEQSQNADPCMVRRAEEYAMKSRFNYDGNANKTQEGTITYRFIYR